MFTKYPKVWFQNGEYEVLRYDKTNPVSKMSEEILALAELISRQSEPVTTIVTNRYCVRFGDEINRVLKEKFNYATDIEMDSEISGDFVKFNY